jgi:hypothetical protein
MLAGRMKLQTFLLIATALMITFSVLAFKGCSKASKTDEAGYPVASGAAVVSAPPPAPPVVASGSAGAALVAGSAAPPAGNFDLPARPYDTAILAFKGKHLDSDRIKDASKSETWKISVYQDSGQSTVNRIKVDVNRNGKWDEKITFDGDKVKLARASADDEKYDEEYRWEGGGWRKK